MCIRDSPASDDYRLALRLGFVEHGLPQEIQCDHASIFYDNQHESPFPTLFHLWLISLGIKVVFSRVRIPQDQGKVERQHRTTWAQIQRKKGFQAWLKLYDHAQKRRFMLNHHIPCRTLDEKAPLEVFPDNYHSGRIYRPEQELTLMDLMKVDHFLQKKSWTRTVCANGAVKIANKQYYLKRAGAQVGDKLTIKYDAFTRNFSFFKDDLLLGHRLAKGIEKSNLIGEYPLRMLPGFQLQIPFDTHSECLLRLFES